MANYGDNTPGPAIGGARRKPRALWRTRFSASSDEDASRLPGLEEESPRRGRRRVISVSRRSSSQVTVEEDDGQGDYEDEDYIDPDVLQSYYAVEQAEQEEEDDASSLGIVDQGVRGRRSQSPQHPLGMRPGDENVLEMAKGVLPPGMPPVPLQVPPPEYLFPGAAEGAQSASEAASVVKESMSRLKQKIEDLTNMRVETRSVPRGQGGSPVTAERLLQQARQEADARYQEEKKQLDKQERIRRLKRRILQKTLKQAIRRAMEQYREGRRPAAGRRGGIAVPEPEPERELIQFSPTEVQRHVQDFGPDAADLQPIGDNLMGFSPSPKRAKAVPPVGLFLDAPRLVAVKKRLDFSGNEGLPPEKQDFWWRSPEVQVFRRQMTPPVEAPSPPEMDLLTGGPQQIPARRGAESIPGVIPTCYG